MPLSNPTPFIAYASLTGSADVSSAALLPHTNPATPSANPPYNEQQTTNNEHSPIPHSLDLSSPAAMDRVRLAAAYHEQDLIASCEARRALDPADPAFSLRLQHDAKTLHSVTAVRKTIITLDRYLEDYTEYLAQKAAVQAQAETAQAHSQAEQARLEAEAEARAELRRQGIDRAEALLTQLAAEDPAFQAALTKAGADLAAEFARLRDPEIVSPVQAQKQIDDEARQVAYKILSTLYNAHPYSGLAPSRHADAADRLARAERGEPLPDPAPDDDDDDDWGDDDDDWDNDESDFDDTGSADVPSASAPADQSAPAINESPGARASSPADASINQSPSGIHEDAASLGPRTASSATASARPLAPVSPFNPQIAIHQWQSHPATPATPNASQSPNNEQQTTNNVPSSNPQSSIIHIPQSAIRNCVVPVCPTLSPRRLQSILDIAPTAPDCGATQLNDANAPTNSIPEPAPDSTPSTEPSYPASTPNAIESPNNSAPSPNNAAPLSQTLDIGPLTNINSSHPFAHVLRRARARPDF